MDSGLKWVGILALVLGVVFGGWKAYQEWTFHLQASRYLLEPVGRTEKGEVVTRREILDALILQAQRGGKK